jgi:uncharacterized protein (TIGR00369 family)
MPDERTARDVTATVPVGRPSGFRNLVGYRTSVWREGYAEMTLAIGPEHLNSLGIVHGGVHAALLDAACGHAATFASVPGNVRRSVTLSLSIAYLAPARNGSLKAIGKLEAIDANRMATVTAQVIGDDGTLHATAQAAFRYERGSERGEGVGRESCSGQL